MSGNKIISNTFGKTIVRSALPIDVRHEQSKNYHVLAPDSHLILSSSAGSVVYISGSANARIAFSGAFSGSADISGGRLSNISASGTFSGAFSGSVDVNGGNVNNRLGHLILSSSLGSFVQISASLKASGSGHAITGTLSLLDGISASYYDARNTTSNYHLRAVNSHLILSSSAGSVITISGALDFPKIERQYSIRSVGTDLILSNSFGSKVVLSGSRLIFTDDAPAGGNVVNRGGHLILTSSGGSVVTISGSLYASGSKHTITGTLSLFDGISASYYDARNTTSNYHVRATNSHLILSSSVGSQIKISGSMQASGSTHTLTGTLTSLDGFTGSYFVARNTTDKYHVQALSSHLILSSSAGSVITVSGSFQASGSHTLTGTLNVTDDVNARGGYRMIMGPAITRNQGANVSAPMSSPADGAASTSWDFVYVATHPGSIVGISAIEIAGSAVAGQAIAFSASINGTPNATAKLGIPVGQYLGNTTFAKDAVTFEAGYYLGITLKTVTGYSSTGNDYVAYLTLEM